MNLRKWKQLFYNSYPGGGASHGDKNRWAKGIEEEARRADAALDATRPHEPTALIRNILLETTTDTVFVQLLIAGHKASELRLQSKAQTIIYGPPGRGAPDFIIAASCKKPKFARTQDVLDSMLTAVGLPVTTYVRCAPCGVGLSAEADINFHLPERLGEAIFFPGPVATVAFEVLTPGAPESALEKACRDRARNYKGLGFIFVRRLDANAAALAAPVSRESHHVLWFAEEGEVDRVRRHLRWGEGEAEQIKRRLDARTDTAADLKLRMVRAEVEHVRTMRASTSNQGGAGVGVGTTTADTVWPRRLAALLAVSLELVNDPAFLALSSHPTSVVDTLRDVANYWRTHLLKNEPRTLGLGLPGDMPSVTSSYEALLALLKLIKTQLEGYRIMHDNQPYEIRFPCMPRKPSKKNAASTKRRTSAHSAQPRLVPPTTTSGAGGAGAGAGASAAGNTPAPAAVSTPIGDGTHSRPAGRNPVDSSGVKMDWDSTFGVWRSKSNPEEVKVPGKKRASSSAAAPPAPMPVAPVTNSPTSQTPTSAGAMPSDVAMMPPPPPPDTTM